MSVEETVAELIKEVTATRTEIAKGDDARTSALAELRKDVESGSKTVADVVAKIDRISADMAAGQTKVQGLEEAIKSLSRKFGRPGGDADPDEVSRKAA